MSSVQVVLETPTAANASPLIRSATGQALSSGLAVRPGQPTDPNVKVLLIRGLVTGDCWLLVAILLVGGLVVPVLHGALRGVVDCCHGDLESHMLGPAVHFRASGVKGRHSATGAMGSREFSGIWGFSMYKFMRPSHFKTV